MGKDLDQLGVSERQSSSSTESMEKVKDRKKETARRLLQSCGSNNDGQQMLMKDGNLFFIIHLWEKRKVIISSGMHIWVYDW